MVYKVFDNKPSGSGIKKESFSNKELLENLIKKVHSTFIDNIQGADLAGMQLISKCNKGLSFLLHVIDIYSICALVIPLYDKKGITITNASQKMLKESNRKPNKIWVDKGLEFYNRSMKSWLEKNAIGMH